MTNVQIAPVFLFFTVIEAIALVLCRVGVFVLFRGFEVGTRLFGRLARHHGLAPWVIEDARALLDRLAERVRAVEPGDRPIWVAAVLSWHSYFPFVIEALNAPACSQFPTGRAEGLPRAGNEEVFRLSVHGDPVGVR